VRELLLIEGSRTRPPNIVVWKSGQKRRVGFIVRSVTARAVMAPGSLIGGQAGQSEEKQGKGHVMERGGSLRITGTQ